MERDIDLKQVTDGRKYSAGDMVKAGCEDCKGCSACCRGMGESIVLDPLDLFRLEQKTGKSAEELLSTVCSLRVVDGVILPYLKMAEGSDHCSFLNEAGRCSIHEARPGFCRMFPLGRLYENGTFSYILQVNECKKANKTKVKVRKWLDTPQLEQYERYVTRWHYFLKDIQEKAKAGTDTEWLRNKSMMILQNFYLLPFSCEKDFYQQFAERIAQAERGMEK